MNLQSLKTRIQEPCYRILYRLLMKSAYGRKGRYPFDAEELRLVREALASQKLCATDGKMVARFEDAFARAYGVPHAVASTSGTAAIHVALGALDLNPGDEVITAPITDLGTIIPILYQNAIPVFADVDSTYTIDPASVEARITERTRAILAVHLFGNPCDMDALCDIARRRGLALVEDCSQAHLAEYRGRLVGTIGDLGCFSFQQSKQMTTGDGGMTITANAAFGERMRLFADKGFARKGWGPRAYLFHAPNYRMNEMVGAVGLAQLGKIGAVVAKRRDLAAALADKLSDLSEHLAPVVMPEGARSSHWTFPIELCALGAEPFALEMRRHGVSVNPGYIGKPIYLCADSLAQKKTYGDSQCPFTCGHASSSYDYREGLCPVAEEKLERLVCIPLDEGNDLADVARIDGAIRASLESLAARPITAAPRPAPVRARTAAPATVRVGIVGCGQIARWHLDSYRRLPHVEVAAVADTDFERASAFAREIGARAYPSHRELLQAERLDAASVCTVPATHREIVTDLLAGRVHVLCEKPLATSAEDARLMARAADQHGRLLMTAFKFRFHDEVRAAAELLGQRRLGRVLSFRLMFGGFLDMSRSWHAHSELSGGGVIADNGPHAFDLVRHLLGPIHSIWARLGRFQPIDVEDIAQVAVVVEDGPAGSIDLSWSVSACPSGYLEIYGSEGSAALDTAGLSYRLNGWSEPKRLANRASTRDAFARQIEYFLGAAAGHDTLGLSAAEGVFAAAAVEAAYESARRGAAVTLDASIEQPEYACSAS